MRRFGLAPWLLNVVLAISTAAFILSSSPCIAQEQPSQPPAKSAAELEALLAPVALYPDQLLANVLMASTYPLEVVSAARWQEQNAKLKDSALDSALAKQTWDDSVKALARVPAALKMMNERLDWTQKLGDAFLAQQEDVMKAVQTLRARAQQSGTLKDTPQQKVVVEEKTIVIEPAQPDVVYVPYYDTRTVYGTWPPTYPPYYWGAPYGYAYGTGAAAFGFVAGVAITAAFWNNGCNWGGNNVYVNSNRSFNSNTNINRGDRAANRADRAGDRSANRADRSADRNANRADRSANRGDRGGNRGGQSWNHNPSHRGGVNYSNNQLRDKYGKGTRPGAGSRESFRGFEDRRGAGNSAYNIGDRGNTAGNRDGARDRGSISGGDRTSRDRASAGNRQAGNGGNRVADRGGSGRRDMNNASARGGGFDGVGRGSQTRQYSQRGSSSMASRGGGSSRSMSRGGGGGGGGGRSMSRGGGGGGRRR